MGFHRGCERRPWAHCWPWVSPRRRLAGLLEQSRGPVAGRLALRLPVRIGFLDLQATRDAAAVKEHAEEVSKSQLDVRNVLCWRDTRRRRAAPRPGRSGGGVSQRCVFTLPDCGFPSEGLQGQIKRTPPTWQQQ